jgi:hypothetical protein
VYGYPTQAFALRWLASADTPPFPMQQLLLPGGVLLKQHAKRHAGDWSEGGKRLFFTKPVESRRLGWGEENMHRRKLTTTYNGLNETQQAAVSTVGAHASCRHARRALVFVFVSFHMRSTGSAEYYDWLEECDAPSVRGAPSTEGMGGARRWGACSCASRWTRRGLTWGCCRARRARGRRTRR